MRDMSSCYPNIHALSCCIQAAPYHTAKKRSEDEVVKEMCLVELLNKWGLSQVRGPVPAEAARAGKKTFTLAGAMARRYCALIKHCEPSVSGVEIPLILLRVKIHDPKIVGVYAPSDPMRY